MFIRIKSLGSEDLSVLGFQAIIRLRSPEVVLSWAWLLIRTSATAYLCLMHTGYGLGRCVTLLLLLLSSSVARGYFKRGFNSDAAILVNVITKLNID